jgi:hypothetical protein
MPAEEIFYLNYYVGALLSQGGDLSANDQRLLFSPTGPFGTAVAPHEVVIPLPAIQAFEWSGGLSRTVRIQVQGTLHKFEGSQANRLGEWLKNKLPGKVALPRPVIKPLHPIIGPKFSCDQCTEILHPGYKFCTRCGHPPRAVCFKCLCLVDFEWSHCAYCGAKVSPAL